MFGLFNKYGGKPLSISELQLLQMISQQVVLSLEGSVRLPGAKKKKLAMTITAEILKEAKLPEAPERVMDTAIEASVHLMNHLGRENKTNSFPRLKVDISGRPKTSGGVGPPERNLA